MLIHILSPACLSSHSVTTSPHSLTASPISICQMLHPLWGPHGHPPSQVIPLLPRIRVLCQYLHDSASPSCVYRVHPRCKKGGKNWTWTQESGCEPCHCENWADTSSFLPGLSQGIKEVHVQNIQHRDSPELMVSHYFLDEQLHSNDVFGFVLKIIWQLAWELVPSTLWTFFESILNTICHCLGIFFFQVFCLQGSSRLAEYQPHQRDCWHDCCAGPRVPIRPQQRLHCPLPGNWQWWAHF